MVKLVKRSNSSPGRGAEPAAEERRCASSLTSGQTLISGGRTALAGHGGERAAGGDARQERDALGLPPAASGALWVQGSGFRVQGSELRA